MTRTVRYAAVLVAILMPAVASAQAAAQSWPGQAKVESRVYRKTCEGCENTRGYHGNRWDAHHILPGVTRGAVLRLAQEESLAIEERPFTVAEAMQAREAFLTAASAFVLPVVEIDGKPIGHGRPGPMAKEFRRLYIEEAGKG